LSFAALLAGVALIAGLAGAQPEPWVHPDGSIHYYDAISAPNGINWNAAFDSAEGYGGYLATMTSQAENNFVFSLIDPSRCWYQRPGTGKLAGPWIGGSQLFGAEEPDSGWHWGTSESMNYVSWSPGQPDNNGNENALHFGESTMVRVPTWDDASALDDSIRGFVRELSADSTTVGLQCLDSTAWQGYTLFANIYNGIVYLIDEKGRAVHQWSVPLGCVGGGPYLLENGLLSQLGNLALPPFYFGGRVTLFDWDGNPKWTFTYCDSTRSLHHDAIWLPNGHMLAIAYELKTKDQAIAAGRDTTRLTDGFLGPDELIEVDTATKNIVWEWHVWDHLIQDYDSTKENYGVVADHPELVDLNVAYSGNPSNDWLHSNGLDYNASFDQIMVSVHGFSEVWVIDHSTTTAQAAGHTGGRYGHGGDLLYRWGNPQTYRRGDSTNQQLFTCHDAEWIKAGLRGAGDIMVFDNGESRTGGPSARYSTVQEITPPVDSTGHYQQPAPGQPYGPSSATWKYSGTPPTSFYGERLSMAQRLPNGHTLICEGTRGRFFEVGPDSAVVWSYINPFQGQHLLDTMLHQGDTVPHRSPYKLQNSVFRSPHYAPDYPGLQGHDLTPGYPLELYVTRQTAGVEQRPPAGSVRVGLSASPNPFGEHATIRFNLSHAVSAQLGIYSVDGRLVRTLKATNRVVWNGRDNAGNRVGRGVYYCRLHGRGFSTSAKLVKME